MKIKEISTKELLDVIEHRKQKFNSFRINKQINSEVNSTVSENKKIEIEGAIAAIKKNIDKIKVKQAESIVPKQEVDIVALDSIDVHQELDVEAMSEVAVVEGNSTVVKADVIETKKMAAINNDTSKTMNERMKGGFFRRRRR